MPTQFHKFTSKAYPDALIICEEFIDLEEVYLLRRGQFIYADGAISVFDHLILPKAGTERVEEQSEKGGRRRRGSS